MYFPSHSPCVVGVISLVFIGGRRGSGVSRAHWGVCISLGGGALSPWVRRPAHPPLLHVGASGSHCSPPLPALLSAVLIGGVFHPWNQMLQKVPLETEEFRGHCSDRPAPPRYGLPAHDSAQPLIQKPQLGRPLAGSGFQSLDNAKHEKSQAGSQLQTPNHL